MRLYPSATLLARFADAVSSLHISSLCRSSHIVCRLIATLTLLYRPTPSIHHLVSSVHAWGTRSTLKNGPTQIIAELRGMAQADDIAVNTDRGPESISAHPASTTGTASDECSWPDCRDGTIPSLSTANSTIFPASYSVSGTYFQEQFRSPPLLDGHCNVTSLERLLTNSRSPRPSKCPGYRIPGPSQAQTASTWARKPRPRKACKAKERALERADSLENSVDGSDTWM